VGKWREKRDLEEESKLKRYERIDSRTIGQIDLRREYNIW
jgi:hypothetical protein